MDIRSRPERQALILGKAALSNLHEKQVETRVFVLPDLLRHTKNFDLFKQARRSRMVIEKLNWHHRY